MKKLFGILKERIDEGKGTTMVSVTGSSGSTPRGAGARMLVGTEGRLYGTIGGGSVEFSCQQKAQEVIETKKSYNHSYRLKPNQVQDIGMVCGGDVDTYFQFINPEDENMKAVVEGALELFEEDVDFWLITDITEGELNEMGLYSREHGLVGISVSDKVIDSLRMKPYRINLDGKRYYIEQINENGKVFIFGGGHVAQQLVPTLARLKFRCIVLEDREDFTREELFPGVLETRLVDMMNLDEVCQEITENDYICIMTRGHKDDYEVQRQILKTPAKYIGAIGSQRKTETIFGKLRNDDGYSEDEIKRITAPIGIPLACETPAEIAISIAAQMINVRANSR